MKTNKKFLTILTLLTLCIALLLTACGTTDAAGTDKTNESLTETGTVSTDSSNTALDDLYQQENQIFADHEAVWNKVFGMMSKSDADPSGNYADYLADTVEANKDSFTEDELKTLTDDIETIRKIEEQIAEIVSRQEAACGITHILAPVLDISRDSRMGRQGETYGEDPALASAMGAAYVRGVQKNETAGRKPESVAKHFLAFHNSNGGIHGAVSDTPPRLLEEIYGKP